nr:DUF4256 domain-containing protein [Sporosarcina sp. PTS2304]
MKMKNVGNTLSSKQREQLLQLLQERFEKHPTLHKDIKWSHVQKKLESNNEKLWSLSKMEETGGEPNVVGYDEQTDEYIFYDCAAESPAGRRSTCYDLEALQSRKKNKPQHSAVELAEMMGIELLTEEEYRKLQTLGEYDKKTSSWIQTPVAIRKLGGAIFCDRRYDTVFVYHNGAESYYAGRGFRGSLRV